MIQILRIQQQLGIFKDNESGKRKLLQYFKGVHFYMTYITISNLNSADTELLADSDNFLTELDRADSIQVIGGKKGYGDGGFGGGGGGGGFPVGGGGGGDQILFNGGGGGGKYGNNGPFFYTNGGGGGFGGGEQILFNGGGGGKKNKYGNNGPFFYTSGR
jgi:hypothetical protein